MGAFKRRHWRLACCHLCEKRLGAPRLYLRAREKRAWRKAG